MGAATDFTMGKHGVTVASVAAAHWTVGLRPGDLVIRLAGVDVSEVTARLPPPAPQAAGHYVLFWLVARCCWCCCAAVLLHCC